MFIISIPISQAFFKNRLLCPVSKSNLLPSCSTSYDKPCSAEVFFPGLLSVRIEIIMAKFLFKINLNYFNMNISSLKFVFSITASKK